MKPISEILRLLLKTIKWALVIIVGMAHQFLQMKQFGKAGRFFKMNADNYPESFNVYDSYGDYFEATGDKLKARENYGKALFIKESAETRKKLEELLK